MGQLINGKDIIVLNYVDPSLTDELLGCHYSQSALWSPLVRRFHYLKVAPAADNSPRTPKPLYACCSPRSASSSEVNRKLLFGSGGGGGCSSRKKSKMKKLKKRRQLAAMSFLKRKIGRFAFNFAPQKRKLGFVAGEKGGEEDIKSTATATAGADCCFLRSPLSRGGTGKGWEKALRITSKQFKKTQKKKKKDVCPPHSMTLADYLRLEDDF